MKELKTTNMLGNKQYRKYYKTESYANGRYRPYYKPNNVPFLGRGRGNLPRRNWNRKQMNRQ